MLTQVRADILSKILADDKERAEKILSLEPQAALKQLNSLGHDYTVEELVEYGEALNASTYGELDADALGAVAGGIIITATVVAGISGAIAWAARR